MKMAVQTMMSVHHLRSSTRHRRPLPLRMPRPRAAPRAPVSRQPVACKRERAGPARSVWHSWSGRHAGSGPRLRPPVSLSLKALSTPAPFPLDKVVRCHDRRLLPSPSRSGTTASCSTTPRSWWVPARRSGSSDATAWASRRSSRCWWGRRRRPCVTEAGGTGDGHGGVSTPAAGARGARARRRRFSHALLDGASTCSMTPSTSARLQMSKDPSSENIALFSDLLGSSSRRTGATPRPRSAMARLADGLGLRQELLLDDIASLSRTAAAGGSAAGAASRPVAGPGRATNRPGPPPSAG